MLPVLFISLLIRGSHQGCGQLLRAVDLATSGGEEGGGPWVVALGVYVEGELRVECTGSLLTPDTLVTAAHCFRAGYDVGAWVVRAGVSDQRFAGVQETGIRRTVSHPDYSSPQVYYDVALAVLEDRLPLGPSISTLCLPDISYVLTMEGDSVTVQGWGQDDDGVIGQTLTEIEVAVR